MNDGYQYPVPMLAPGYQFQRPTIIHRLPELAPPLPAPREITARSLFVHTLWFGATVLTTTFWGWLMFGEKTLWHALGLGLLYSFALLGILFAHEMGHYLACRWYGVSATLPYFIPSPLPPVGTFGAFIKIRSPIPSRRALFDIGIAGPLAGFLFALPVGFAAHYFAQSEPAGTLTEGTILFHSPPLFVFFERWLHLPSDLQANPLWLAAWVGLFMTSLNLMPVGQLDGGHVIYAVFGERGHRLVARTIYAAVLALALYSYLSGGWMGWFVYALLLTLMLRMGHPPVDEEEAALGLARKLVALIGLLVFLLCFTPFPITIIE